MKNNKNNNQKIKHLRAVHLWPSVVFLILTLVLAVGMFMAFITFIPLTLGEERLVSACEMAETLAFTFEDEAGNELEAINALVAHGELKDPIIITNLKNEIIASYRNSYANLEEFEKENSFIGYEGKSSILAEANVDNLINDSGELDEIRLFKKIYDSGVIGSDFDDRAVIMSASFWVENTLTDGRNVYIKCDVPIYYIDFARAAIVSLSTLVAFLLPIFFLLISVIISMTNQNRMKNLLYNNQVTGGKNYTYFEHTAQMTMNSRRNSSHKFMIVDLTTMKYQSYCNYHGIHAGENLLEQIDKELAEYTNKNEFHALAAKHSFVILMRYENQERGEKRIRKMVDSLSEKFDKCGIVFHAGIYFANSSDFPDEIDPAECYNRAESARITLSDENIPSVAVYNDQLLEKQLWEHRVEEKMEEALLNNEFHVYIQPKYDPVTKELAGAEALVRWINDEDGIIPPGKFIPIFEKNGFITKLDDYMILNVAKMQSQWISEGKKPVTISVNVSRAHFANPDLCDHICELVDKYEVPHELLEIELTESAFFDDKAVLLNTVMELRNLGFEVSMDDFGAGYSSLNSLKDLPLDVLKLDADFFRGEAVERGEIVVAQAIKLAKSLNMRIVAEGIEKQEQVEFLAEQGCDMIQGYYFAKPMPAAEYAERLADA